MVFVVSLHFRIRMLVHVVKTIMEHDANIHIVVFINQECVETVRHVYSVQMVLSHVNVRHHILECIAKIILQHQMHAHLNHVKMEVYVYLVPMVVLLVNVRIRTVEPIANSIFQHQLFVHHNLAEMVEFVLVIITTQIIIVNVLQNIQVRHVLHRLLFVRWIFVKIMGNAHLIIH